MTETITRRNGNTARSGSELSEVKRALFKYLISEPCQREAEPTIVRRPAGTPAPLSFPQEQIWLHAQLAGDVPLYNETITLYRHGALHLEVLERCLLEIIRRHEIWRTTFDLFDGAPHQVVQAVPSKFPLPSTDLRGLAHAERESRARAIAAEDARRLFDLRTGPLLRAHVVRTENEEYRVCMTFHQIVFDAVTAYRVFLPELATLYEAFSIGKPSPLPEPKIQYADFAYSQRNEHDAREQDRDYWRKQLAGELPALEWPNDRLRPLIQTHRGEIQRFSLPADIIPRLRTIGHEAGASLYMTLMAGLVALLYRYTGQADIILGSFSAGRNQRQFEGLVGYFVNPLALRFDLSGNPTFRELQERVRNVVLDALAHDSVPFAEVVRQAQQRSDPSRNPLFQIVLSQQPQIGETSGWDLITEEVSNGGSKLDLIFVTDDRGDRVFGPVTYNPDLFDAETVTRTISHWQNLLAEACRDPQKRISDLQILGEEERNRILIEWNNTAKEYINDVCLHELIEKQVERTPEAIALKFEQEQLSYRELNARANQLAHYLRRRGVGPEVLVAVAMERAVEMVVALLGIMKAGGAYLPLDVDHPKDRLRVILEDSRPKVLLTQEHLLDRLPNSIAAPLCLDTEWSRVATEDTSNPRHLTSPGNVAYLIYTSGSTGKPKGVLNIHAGIVNRLLWMQDAYSLTSQDRVLQKTPYTFDVSVWEFFWPLLTGACLVVAKPGGHADPDYLVDLIRREGITTLHFVPSMLQPFLSAPAVERCGSLKRVICSGEALPTDVQRRFFDKLNCELHNLYGPTEAAVDVTYWRCRPDWEEPIVPIGRPIANVQTLILDRNMRPVPVGISGELHIGGVALARGYLNRPELTAERFVSNPFGAAGERLYKTGDLARYRADGNVEFLGRIDDQVKIRGLRIELGEIETVLNQHPAVREGRVVVREDIPNDRRLVAYIVLAGRSDSIPEIRQHLKEKLPGYMVPALVPIEKIPVTANGKLDRRALPCPEQGDAEYGIEERTEAFRNPVERVLAEVWSEVLRLDTVNVYDNFFDLGGHSLLALQVVRRLHDRLGVRIKASELAFQSLGQLAASCQERLACR